MSATQVRRVTARVAHRCTSCDRPRITPGDVYLKGTLFPDGTVGNPVPWTIKKCGFCAERDDQQHILEPLPSEQGHLVYVNAMRHGRG